MTSWCAFHCWGTKQHCSSSAHVTFIENHKQFVIWVVLFQYPQKVQTPLFLLYQHSSVGEIIIHMHTQDP